VCCAQVLRGEIRSGFDEAARIEGDAAVEPLGARRRTGHDEDMSDPARLHRLVHSAPRYLFQMSVSLQSNELGAGMQLDHRTLLDAPNEIARHGVGEPTRADDHMDLARGPRQKDGCLSRGVAATNDDDFFALTE